MKKQSVASVKDRLKNRSKATGKTMQELLVAYGLERTIYRLSISPYVENFTLKISPANLTNLPGEILIFDQ